MSENYKWDFFKEVVAVCLVSIFLTVIIGFSVSWLMGMYFERKGITYEENWWLVMGSTLTIIGLLVGLIFHVGFEVTGWNGYYCEHGVACRKKEVK